MGLSKHALLLVVAILAMYHAVLATATSTATPKLRLFTVFAPTPLQATVSSTPALNATTKSVNSSTALAMLDATPVTQFASDFILIGELLATPARAIVEGYDATVSAQILYLRTRWQLLEEGSDRETVSPLIWARFRAVSDSNATACLGVAQWNASWSENNNNDAGNAPTTTTMDHHHVATLLASVDARCKPTDTVAIALTSPAAHAALTHLEAANTVAATATVGAAALSSASASPPPNRMVEVAHMLQTQQYVSSTATVLDIPSAASSRLLLRLHDSMCADRAATLSDVNGGAVAWDALALELCDGASCLVCKPANFAATHDGDNNSNEPRRKTSTGDSSGTSKPTIVALVCCGLFLVASVPVIFVVFRHQFFAPHAATKDETALTTNLAYVLHI